MRSWLASLLLAAGALAGCVDDPATVPPDDLDRAGAAIGPVLTGPAVDRFTMDPPLVDLTRLGDTCDDLGGCPDGTTCVTYYGVAGSEADPISSCEIPCDRGDPPCPDGTACERLSDGPGAVCRPG